jgi:hypothetical protein
MNNIININTVREERYYSTLELVRLKSEQLEEANKILQLKREQLRLEESIKIRQDKIDKWGGLL